MDRSEYFHHGCSEGEIDAELDLRNGSTYVRTKAENARNIATSAHYNRKLSPAKDDYFAYVLGYARGYRSTQKSE